MHRHPLGVRTALSAAAAVGILVASPATAMAAPAAPTPAPAATTVAAGTARTAAPAGGVADLAGVDYGTWRRDVRAVVDAARPYIEQRSADADGEKQAIVLDIDNTSLETDFHFFLHLPTPAVQDVRELARYAHSRGVAVFFVTARPGIIHALTQYNLKSVGYPVSGLYVRDLPDLFEEVSTYKTAKRAEIEARGYTIIANIGNRSTDLVGGHAERTFKLPDYDGKLS
ncbi:hydrolase [Streptomyces sp. Je 1-79]|uniref:HAD family acid phosphatase n=1 Tax=Streptomyces sp. Je 1-79 TaxID=2943847 RepID=UPI0021A866CE|nr:HAD family acid phosphatase [Streptomyces sp. Je 1-79]MCT4352024.1 hydrolase [Streptomyces sp. Je 1-79]